MTTLTFIIALVVGLLFWLDSSRAREMARALSMELCHRRDYQLLDDSVSLARIALRSTPRGMRLRRMFRFEYSTEGVHRHIGHIILIGSDFERIDFGSEQGDEEPPATDDKVVPFRRKRH